MRSPKDIAKTFEVGCNSRRDAAPRAAARCLAATSFLLPMLFLLILLPGSAIGQAPPVLELKTRIPLPHVNGRMDHLGVDIKGQRLFATAFNNHTVEVIDLKAGRLVRTISNLAEPQGALYDSSANRLFISSSMDGTVKIYNGTNFKILKTVRFSSDADNLRYDVRNNRVVVGYGGEKFLHGKPVPGHHGDGALAFLDSAGKTTGKIAVDAHPESFQLEKSGTRVFVNVPDHKEVDVADVVNKKVLKHGRLLPARITFLCLSMKHIIDCSSDAALPPFYLFSIPKTAKPWPPFPPSNIATTCSMTRAKAVFMFSAKATLTPGSRRTPIIMAGSGAILRLPAPIQAFSCRNGESFLFLFRTATNKAPKFWCMRPDEAKMVA